MTCTHPIWLKDQKIFVPCTKCTQCKIARAREWSIRIINESLYHPENIFVTLTFSELNVPADMSLSKSCLQRFIKRFRRTVEPRKIKYYACGEYGEDKNRPHYHLIMFNTYKSDFKKEGSYYCKKSKKMVDWYSHQSWKVKNVPIGYINIGNVTYDSARYTADYIQKQYYGELAKKIYQNRQQPFQLFSKGLGQKYCKDNKEKLLQMLGDTVQGHPSGLNKYYRKILGVSGEEIHEHMLDKVKENTEEVEDGLQKLRTQCLFDKPEDYTEALKKYYKQIEKNQENKSRGKTRQHLN